jgi:fructose-1,6-bisphosphatase/inositol monophosphatase family enzyme
LCSATPLSSSQLFMWCCRGTWHGADVAVMAIKLPAGSKMAVAHSAFAAPIRLGKPICLCLYCLVAAGALGTVLTLLSKPSSCHRAASWLLLRSAGVAACRVLCCGRTPRQRAPCSSASSSCQTQQRRWLCR